ncbi:MAG: hypothetical protein WC458_00610 [Patescibacteria group bacterium]
MKNILLIFSLIMIINSVSRAQSIIMSKQRTYLQEDIALLEKMSNPTPFDSLLVFKTVNHPDYELCLKIVEQECDLVYEFEKTIRAKKPFWRSRKKHTLKTQTAMNNLNIFYRQTKPILENLEKKYTEFYKETRRKHLNEKGFSLKR